MILRLIWTGKIIIQLWAINITHLGDIHILSNGQKVVNGDIFLFSVDSHFMLISEQFGRIYSQSYLEGCWPASRVNHEK